MLTVEKLGLRIVKKSEGINNSLHTAIPLRVRIWAMVSGDINQTYKKILVVDDDLELCDLLTEFLQPEGFVVDTANTGPDGLDKALTGGYALVVLDVMLPSMGGFDLLRELRGQSDVPVLMLTAKGEEVDRIVGLEMGADDYLPKPFNARELLARIRAVVRRTPEREPRVVDDAAPIVVGDVILDRGSRMVRRSGRVVELTAAEFGLLEVLLSEAGSVVTREDLTRRALGRRLSPYDRSIDVHISSLRKKLGTGEKDTERIRTIRGIGYQYALPDGEIPDPDVKDR